ncbi:MAG TPA: Na+/H+ antiporter NhaA [Gammaproteobacteria bacterium]|nr:Na+/H+ antiporter NhaA [Gammaproteobacteria bacterium]
MPIKTIREFLKLEAASGILLAIASLLALICMNSPARNFYQDLLTQYDFTFIINDGLMAIFFFIVGLEIKREIISGELNSAKKIMLPSIAAFFGMAVPALIYVLFNYQHPALLRGWAIPTATDIAFTLAVLTLLGSRVPFSIKIFLTALAIFDDLGAIIIIAAFYAKNLQLIYLGLSGLVLASLMLLNYFRIKPISIYLLLGMVLWLCILHSGIHPAIAGVLLALTIPTEKIPELERTLHAWVAYLILPMFAFANMGIAVEKMSFLALLTSIPLGIIFGLLIGKFLGVFSSVFIMVKSGFAQLPKDSTWKMMLGASFLCGIGFTMSLFIGDLAFNNSVVELVRAGVLTGSILSGVIGYLIFLAA